MLYTNRIQVFTKALRHILILRRNTNKNFSRLRILKIYKTCSTLVLRRKIMIDNINYKQINSEFMFFKQNSIKESYILNLSYVREFSCYTQTLQSSKNNLLGLKLCRCLCEASVVYVHQRPKVIKSDRYKEQVNL